MTTMGAGWPTSWIGPGLPSTPLALIKGRLRRPGGACPRCAAGRAAKLGNEPLLKPQTGSVSQSGYLSKSQMQRLGERLAATEVASRRVVCEFGVDVGGVVT